MRTTRQYGRKADLALSMWVKLARAFGTFSKLTGEDIRTHGLTPPQFAVLESLGHLGALTLGELSKKQLTSCGNTTVIVDNLEKEGLVARFPSKDDRRVIFARLTPKGRNFFKQIFTKHAVHVEKLASVLSDDEQEELGRLLKKLGMRLQEKR